jgi:hypothetical protein
MAVFQLKREYGGFDFIKFSRDAEEIYVRMNTAFAKGDVSALKECVSDGFLMDLQQQMGKLRKVGTVKWINHGRASKPSLYNLVCSFNT